MRTWNLVLNLSIVTLIISCQNSDRTQTQNKQEVQSKSITRIDRENAINIAKAEALKEKKSLDGYDIKAVEETKTWRVEFQLKDLTMGGGTTFIIDKETGKIIVKRESQ